LGTKWKGENERFVSAVNEQSEDRRIQIRKEVDGKYK
jgi:hypothetical protein